MTRPRRALLSVSDKSGIQEFGRALAERGFELLSTGGTARTLRDAGLEVTDVADVTGHPEIMEGRVKTLHPAIHGPLLARREVEGDMAALETHGYAPIDVVAVNLYPFRETVAREGVTVAQAMGKVDIGGPTMIRAAAKNHEHLWVVIDPDDYPRVIEGLDGGLDAAADDDGDLDDADNGDPEERGVAGNASPSGSDSPSALALRRELAAKVFAHISAYDTAIADFLGKAAGDAESSDGSAGEATELPVAMQPRLTRVASLRYGENPDQLAAFYAPEGPSRRGIASLEQHHGKALSYNNLLDLDGALLSLAPFALSPRPAVCIIKHTTPCGLAVGDSVESAYRRALATDPTSAFGSVIAVNREVDGDAAAAIGELFVECVVAPAFTDEAMEILTGKKNIRLLTIPDGEGAAPHGPVSKAAVEEFERSVDGEPHALRASRFLAAHGRDPEPIVLRGIYGGVLAQSPPTPPFFGIQDVDWKIVTERQPTPREATDLAFAWAAVYGVKSNAILLARDGATLGIGAGQMSRVDASRLAVQKAADAELDLQGCALASDAFFPFRDGVEAAAEAGVRAIIQPGGSIRDEQVIDAANEAELAMVFTGRRLFRH